MIIYRIKRYRHRIFREHRFKVQANSLWGLPFFWNTLYEGPHLSDAIRIRDAARGR